MRSFDLIVIGAGASGLAVAAEAAGFGLKVGLIEQEPEQGGGCLHTGCVTSTALIAVSKEFHSAKKTAYAFGLELQGKVNHEDAYRRILAAIAAIQPHDCAERFRSLGVDVLHGYGQFLDKHHIEMNDGEVVYGKRIVIATGSRSTVPLIDGLQEVDYMTNETVFDLQALPTSLVVIGAGRVGLELAQALARLGSDVTVLDKGPKLLEQEDVDIVPYVQAALEKELSLHLNVNVNKVEAMPDGKKRVYVERYGEKFHMDTDCILIATGRRPNTDRLGLTNIGIAMDENHIVVTRTLQTSVPHIYAVGDVIKPFPFIHPAGMEGKIVVGNAIFGLKRRISYTNVPWVTDVEPEIFHLGMTEEEARKHEGDKIQIYKVPLDQVDRFITDRKTNGIVKVITDRKGRILGAHAAGIGAGDWMQQAVFMKRFGHKLSDISQVVHPYLSHSEALLKTGDPYWREKLTQGGLLKRIVRGYVKWFQDNAQYIDDGFW
ncbi:NAD(P)/FAD-dependent oxidoreductase [Paenibacillus sp. BC26]|uniref:dihydrolipoyl dehydrogenase family protein n=1 Tax=Paenibacillus sp. BC26 TaxID=1881032 RepID=UPI0008F37D05|nr:FAD-dependent oxidoreductase [Paenibacillus sp. BC26]SFT13434.1 Pyruvate/2-oxoglutarate dehydrogenase complex, dihydrolipoamide dehydrogenase (E3) component [Paenibacillus sp. BC26]